MNGFYRLGMWAVVALLVMGCGGGDCDEPNPYYDDTDPQSVMCLDDLDEESLLALSNANDEQEGPGLEENELLEGGGEETSESPETRSENGLPLGWKVIVKKDIPLPEEEFFGASNITCQGGSELAAHDLGTNRPWFRIVTAFETKCLAEGESNTRHWYAILHEETTTYDKDNLIDGKWQIVSSPEIGDSFDFALHSGPLNMWAFRESPREIYVFNREQEVFEKIALPSHVAGDVYNSPSGSSGIRDLLSGIIPGGGREAREGVDWVAFTVGHPKKKSSSPTAQTPFSIVDGTYDQLSIVRVLSDNQVPDVFEFKSE